MRGFIGLGLRVGLIVVLSGLALWQLSDAVYIHAKATLAQQLLERAWDQTDNADSPIAPWPWADTWPVAKLEIPRLKHSLVVLSDATGRSMAFGPGVLKLDALYRTESTVVISGHRDTHFSVLRYFRVGDELTLQTGNKRLTRYRITETRVIDTRREQLLIDQQHSELILTTCYPFGAVDPGGPLRYLVFAEPIILSNANGVNI